MPVKKFSFKDADRQDTSKPAGLPKKKKVSSKFGAKEEASPAPTPKLGLKKKKDAKAEEAAVKIEDKKVHPIKKDEPKAEPVAPPKPPTPEPAEPVVEIEKGDPEINETVVLDPEDPESRDPNGKWWIIKKAADVRCSEGESVSFTIEVGKGDPLHLPRVQWVKGKWNEITAGDRYQMTSEKNSHTLTFSKPKMSDSGIYTIKVSSPAGLDSKTFELKVSPEKSTGSGIVVVRGKLPKNVQEEDLDFRGKLKKVQKQVTKDKEGEKVDIWALLRDSNPRDYDKISFKHGLKDYRGMLKRMAANRKVNKRSNAYEVKLPDTECVANNGKLVFEVTVANEALGTKWFRNGQEITAQSTHFKMEQRGRTRKLIIENANLMDDGLFEIRAGEEKSSCEVHVLEAPTAVTKGFEDLQLVEGEDAKFTATLSTAHGRFKILKDGIEIGLHDNQTVTRDGAVVNFEIKKISKSDAGFYEIQTNGAKSFGELIVDPKPVAFKSRFSDVNVNVNEPAEFSCIVGDAEVAGKWTFNGKPIEESENIQIIADGTDRKLVLKEVGKANEGEYQFLVDSKDHKQPTGITATLKTYSVTVEKPQVPPKICLSLSAEKEIVVKAGQKFTLDIPIAGDPAPEMSWFLGEKELYCENTPSGEFTNPLDRPFDKPFGKPADPKQRVQIKNWPERSRVHIPTVHKADSGVYTLKLKSEAGTDCIDFKLLVIHKPGAPGIPIISELNNECCRVDWTPPVELGGCEVEGYIVERKKTSSSRWIRLNSKLTTFHNHLARRMVEGTAYQVRVTAVNQVGVGEPSPVSESFTPMAPTSEIPSIRKGLTTDESIELKWAAPEDQGALGMKGYLIQLQVLKNPSSENPLMELEDDAWEDWKKTKVAPDANSQILDGLDTGKTYMFRMAAENAAGRSKWTTFGPVVCAEAMEDPRINLPRPLTRLVKIRCGEKLHFQCPFVGRPKPVVTWTKVDSLPEEGVNTLPEGVEEKPLGEHVTVRESVGMAVIHIRNTDRSDTGCYKMRLAVGDKEAVAIIRVAIVEPPSKPRALKIIETIGTSVQLAWEAPKDDGNTEIFAYTVEKRDKRSGAEGQWFIVYEKIRHCKCSIDDLIMGNEFQFRVKAQNEVGLSEGIATKDFAKIEKETLTYVKPEYRSRDVSQPPSFTLPLNNRKLTVGYTGTISCSIRGHPKPKIRWFKNKIEIIDNPKYKMSASLGVVQLEIRRPRQADQGTYTCLAYNDHGEVSCDAQVMVREPK